MIRMVLAGSSLIATCMLSGCSHVPVDQLSVGTSMITNGGGKGKWEEIPMSAVQLKDPVFMVSYVQWSASTTSAGTHDVKWFWYSGERLVHTWTASNLEFKTTPFRLWCRTQAAGLGVGHFRVQLVVDDKPMATNEFDVIDAVSDEQHTEIKYDPGSAGATKDSGTPRSVERVVAHCPNALQAAKDVGFPPEAATAGFSGGSVTVSFVLTPQGGIQNVAVVGSTDRSFNQAAIDTVTRLKCSGSGLTQNTELRWVMEYHVK